MIASGIGVARRVTEARFLIDTNICIYLLEGRGADVRQRFESCPRGELVTSAIVRAEVMIGAKRRGQSGPAEALFAMIEALPFDAAAADVYAGLPFVRGNLDRLIAAHALALDLILVTNNERDFAEVPGLVVENWTK